MADHPIVTLARRAWDAAARSDVEGMREILHPDIVWHATGATPWAGVHRGFDAVLDYLAKVGDSTDEFDAQLQDILVSNERALLLFHVTLGLGGTRIELGYTLLARVDDDRVLEAWTAPLDPTALRSFWN